MTALFITATGPRVGKTYAVASLIGHLRQMGRDVEAYKPVVTGFDATQLATSDPGLLLTALGLAPTLEAVERVSPWRFRAAFAPDLAARLERRRIDTGQVVEFCQNAIEGRRDLVLIDGVGGIMVPLDDQRTILDVMMALRVPLILVTGSHLGTISHTLTALDSLYRRDLTVMAVIVNETPGSTLPLDAAVASIARFAEPVIGVPRHPSASGESRSGSAFGRLFGRQGARSS